jgi:hypothetical protein
VAQQASNSLGVPSGPVTSISVFAETLYDSNVASSGAALARERGLKPADEITTPSAVINLARVLLGQVVFLKGSAGYDFYSVNHTLDRERIDLTGGVNANLLTCEEVVSGEYRRSQVNLVDVATKAVSDAISAETVQGTVTCGGAIGLTPRISVSNTWRTNSAPQLQFSNDNILSVNAAMGYRQPAIGVVSVIGQFSEVEFPNVLYLTKGGDSLNGGFDIYSAGLTYDRHISARLDGSATVTYTWLEQNVSLIPGFEGYTYNVDFRYRVTPLLGAHVGFSRAALPSNETGANFYVDETYRADISYRVGPRINLRLRGYETFRQYGGVVDQPDNPTLLTKETIRGVGVSCAYNFTPHFSLSLDTGDEERHAELASFSYSAFHVGLTLAARY